jgi:hypothetical protein
VCSRARPPRLPLLTEESILEDCAPLRLAARRPE